MEGVVAVMVLALGLLAPAAHAAFGIQDFTAEVRKAATEMTSRVGGV